MKINRLQTILVSLLLFSSLSLSQYTDPFAPKKEKPATVQSNPYGTTYQNSGTYNNQETKSTTKTTYDWNSGNTYNTTKSSNGTTQMNGYNYNTGSTWDTQYKSNGNMSGQDKKGNSWDYNKSTGVYNNYGTGEVRIKGESIYKPKK